MIQNNKKGISLIVLIITIIVMIVIAGAIILTLNSANVTGKASWAQISSDRANLQSEYATILADTIANEKTGDYLGITVADVISTDAYKEWEEKVKTTNSRFSIYVPEDNTNPAGIKVVIGLTEEELGSFGIEYDEENKIVKGYDWVISEIVEEPETAENAVTIPEGFTASIFDTEDEVEEGLVIYKTDAATLNTYKNKQEDAKKAFDQFVWVPVTYTKTNTDNDNNGTDDGFDSVFKTTEWSNNAPTTILSTSYTEPSSYNGSTAYRYETEVEEYNEMRESVEEHGGFFIARYEAGDGDAKEAARNIYTTGAHTVVSKKGAYVYNWVAWGKDMTDPYSEVSSEKGYGAVYLSKNMYPENSNYTTHLIYGVQWDATLNWLRDKYDVTNSRSWGNHSNSISPANVNSGSSNMDYTTGRSDEWKAKNIYDLAGNVWEWTMEAYSSSSRVLRGGHYDGLGNRNAASSRNSIFSPYNMANYFGFRPALYLN